MALLLLHGNIGKKKALAADQFRQAFRTAHLDPLRAVDLSRVPTGRGRGRGYDAPTWARTRVRDAIEALGGQRSLVSSVLWHCVGLEWSVRQWSRTQGGVGNATGGGLLLAALTILAAKEGGRRSSA